MATRSEFVAIIEEVCKNHGVYIGTGNGELVESLTIKKINTMEKNYGDSPARRTNQVLSFIGSCYEKGYDMSKAVAGDCSGIIVYALMTRLKVIKSDMRAKDFQAKSTATPLNSLIPGDLVFNAPTNCSHVGVYVGDNMVIESRGRDYGVVKRKLGDGAWVVGGRLPWFDDDPTVKFTRNLKYVKNSLMRGEDVLELQKRLTELDMMAGECDGIFGLQTKAAVLAFQQSANLEIDGIAGKNTITAMGLTWG